ncbi:MAG: hypothetical protein IKK10_00260 [Clostridia bacterium]|nr:hypothetical protein [Clostridia bacterium]
MRTCYGYTELLEDLLKLSEVYKDKISIKITGTSVKGRLLPLIKMGGGNKKLLVAGAVHGRESVTSAFIMKSLEELLKSGCEFAEKSLYVLPMVNPDGVEIFLKRDLPQVTVKDFKGELFKNNANNINLNANFPFCFSKVPPKRQGGAKSASEPEVKSLIKLCEKERFESAVSLHARGNCIFWRDYGNKAVKGDLELAKSFEQNCCFEIISPTQKVEDYSGGFENWFRCRYRKPALCIELVKDEDISFSDMIINFEEAVIWEKTKNLLITYLNFS